MLLRRFGRLPLHHPLLSSNHHTLMGSFANRQASFSACHQPLRYFLVTRNYIGGRMNAPSKCTLVGIELVFFAFKLPPPPFLRPITSSILISDEPSIRLTFLFFRMLLVRKGEVRVWEKINFKNDMNI